MDCPPLTEDLVELLSSGADMYIATRDAELRPESMFGMGLRPHLDRCQLTVYLPQIHAERTRQNLLDNGHIAVTIVRPIDHASVQIKGKFVDIRASEEADREFQLLFRSALVEQFALVGVPRPLTRRLVWWPSWAVTLTVDDVFSQTPGPRAGERLSVAGRAAESMDEHI